MQKIPKIFHQIWLGGKPLPSRFFEFQKTWKDLHPDWKMKMWNETNLHEIPEISMDDLILCKNYAEQADYLRLFIIKAFGGVYIDTDFECLKNINELLNSLNCFLSLEGTGKNNQNTIANSIFGSVPNHQFFGYLCQRLSQRILLTVQLKSSTERIGPFWIAKMYKEYPEKDQIYIFEKEVFFEVDHRYFFIGRHISETFKVKLKCYAIHHYSSSHISFLGVAHKYIWNIPLVGKKMHYMFRRLTGSIKNIFG